MQDNKREIKIRLHFTNVFGVGAAQLLQSLFPAFVRLPNVTIERIYLSDEKDHVRYKDNDCVGDFVAYHRCLPNALSRLLECTWFASRFNGETPLLVLGDMPLLCRGPQTVFVQNSNLLEAEVQSFDRMKVKNWVSRVLFRVGINRVRSIIVQTEVMRNRLESSYPSVTGRVHVIAQPVPTWLLESGLFRRARLRNVGQSLDLIYPAAAYPHKNHGLLSLLNPSVRWPVERLTLTLDALANPAPALTWINCVGLLPPLEMIEAYSKVDALLFLSREESYGFPLVEAMFVGLPIVCPDLPYARKMCGEQAIYFDASSPDSLLDALIRLHAKLEKGWWPDWSAQLVSIPPDWETVARKMVEVTCN